MKVSGLILGKFKIHMQALNKPMNSFAGSLGRLLAGWRHYVPEFSQRSVALYGGVIHNMNKLNVMLLGGMLLGCSSISAPDISKDVVSDIVTRFQAHPAFCGNEIRRVGYCPDKESTDSKQCYRVSTSDSELWGNFVEIIVSSGKYSVSDRRFDLGNAGIIDVKSGCVR
jgi:hypothetical protein